MVISADRGAGWCIIHVHICWTMNTALHCVPILALSIGIRDAREWLFTFPLPPIPVQSIPIPSHSHSQFCNQFPFPWDSQWESYGIPIPIGNPIPMVISNWYRQDSIVLGGLLSVILTLVQPWASDSAGFSHWQCVQYKFTYLLSRLIVVFAADTRVR